METLEERLIRLRKQQGLTQEMLADKAGINLRTLQRLEKGESIPRGNTLKHLSVALGVSVEELTECGKKEDRDFLMWFQLSPMVGWVWPVGFFLAPLALWLVKRDKIADLEQQGINLLNFQLFLGMIWLGYMSILMLCIASMGGSLFGRDFSFLGVQAFMVGAPILNVLSFIAKIVFFAVLPLIAASRARKDEPLRLFYPRILSWIR